MVFIWRGGGIIVPIFLVISGWLTGYAFDDVRFGNNVFMGWTMIWASIPLGLLGLAFIGMNAPDPETGEQPPKSRHDFFFIPVWIWALFFLVFGIYWVNKDPDPGFNYTNDVVEQTADNEDRNVSNNEGSNLHEQIVNFYNPYEDTVNVQVDSEDGEGLMDSDIPPGHIRYFNLEKGHYVVKHYGMEDEIYVKGSEAVDSTTYDEAWFVAGGGYDLIFLDVTEACTDAINKTELRDIDWTSRVEKRHAGNEIMFPRVYGNGKTKYLIKEPGFTLPTSVQENQKVFALIPIKHSQETTEEYLDEMVIDICY
ncbi:MAG: hypothetical protein MK078_16080 [Crocinitomicaceae bacterium]|nr:hypothetical protein [Crocinitomicaceae bacterium]